MIKRIGFMLAIVVGVGLLLGYGREVLAYPVHNEDWGRGAALSDLQADSKPSATAMDDFSVVLPISETIKLASPQPATNGWFGWGTALQDDLLVVGQLGGGSANIKGSAYVFERNNGGPNTWGLTVVLTPLNGTINDRFGVAVAVDNNIILVGAHQADVAGIDSGAAYIFERIEGGTNNWGEVAQLIGNDSAPFDTMGNSIAIEGDTAVVGAWTNDTAGSDSGAVYIFDRNTGGNNSWGQIKKLLASDAGAIERFGVSVAISGDILVVGAHWKDENGTNSGAAYIFERNLGGANNWGEVAKLVPSVSAPWDQFGGYVAVEGDLVVIGARPNEVYGTGPGSVFIFERNAGGLNNWGEVTRLLASDTQEGDGFGANVAIEADTLLVSADHGDGLFPDTGAVYIFKQNMTDPDAWDETYKIIASDGNLNDRFGWRSALSGSTIIVGAYLEDSLCDPNPPCDSGSVYIYSQPLLADVAIAKTVSSSTAVPGQPLTYTLTFTNNGPDVAFGTLITDLVPTGVVNPAFTNSGAMITQTGSVPFSWQVADLAPGEGGVITITGIISPELLSETMIVNTAVITNSLDITPTNNSSTAVTQVNIPEVSLSAADYVVAEDGGMVTVTAVLSPAQPFLDVTVTFETSDGSALAGEDYTAVTGTLTFTAGLTQTNLLIPILDDSLVESDESFTLALTDPVNATLGNVPEATITIVNDDTLPWVSLSANSFAVLEDVAEATITVTLSQPYPQPVLVGYETEDGTAVAGEDYTATAEILTLTPGMTQTTFTIPITDDLLVELDEMLTILLTDFTNAIPLPSVTATLTILNNDEEAVPESSYLYLPIILSPTPTPPPPDFPILISEGVAPRPIMVQGEIFYTATIQIPADLPATGQFFLSASSNQIDAISVDDELAFVENGEERFVKRFSLDGQTIHAEIVLLPRQTLSLMAGETVTVIFRDVFGDHVSATPIWLIHIP